MPAKKGWPTWLIVILVGFGLVVLAIPALWVYMSATATALHPSAKDAPSVAYAAPSVKWSSATERGRQITRASLSEENLPGLSVAVGIDGEVVSAEGFGFADLENRVPVTPNHRFRIGTASTVLTSAGAGLLMEEDRLNFDDPVQKQVPAFPEKQWPVTLRQLMGHVAGLQNGGGDEAPLLSEHCGRPVDALRHFAERPLMFEPGTRFQFSSYGWILVSAAIEAASGKPFVEFMRERVFDRLEMSHTVADSTTTPIAERATTYFPRFAADPTYGLQLLPNVDYSCYAGSSVFLSTPSDLVRFGMAIQRGKLLRPKTVETLQTSQRLMSGESTGYGLGWDNETVAIGGKQTQVTGHDGEILGGMAASLMTFPEYGMVVAVTSNISYAKTFALGAKIAEAFVERK